MFLDILVEVLAPIIVCLLTYPLASRLFKDKYGFADTLVVSLILSLAFLLLLPYCISIIFDSGFRIVSWIIFLIGLVSIFLNSKIFVCKTKLLLSKFYNSILNRNLLNITFGFVLIGFFIKYIYYILIRAVTDWDAIKTYLIYSKAIVLADSIPLVAFDFARLTKPVGISFLYAWSYSLSESTSAETFRLIPIAFTLITVLLVYLVAREVSSDSIAKCAAIIFIILPLHDSILYYCLYYPDIAFYSLILSAFYFLYKYSKTFDLRFCIFSGLAIGLSSILKAQIILYFIPIIIVFISLIRYKALRIITSFSVPFIFLFILFLIDSSNTFSLKYTDSLVLVVFAIMSSFMTFLVEKRHKIKDNLLRFSIPLKGLFVCICASSVALLWYLRIYFEMGTLIWLSSINELDLQWSISILSDSLSQTILSQSPIYLFFIFISIFVHPILGSVWLIPKIIGIVKSNNKIMMVHIWVIGFIISFLLYSFSRIITHSSFNLNPRDLVPLAPFFSIYAAIGLFALAVRLNKALRYLIVLSITLLFGCISLAQSLLLLYFPPDYLKEILIRTANFSLTSLKLFAHGSPDVALNWVLFGIIIGSPLLILLLMKKCYAYLLKRKKIHRVVIHFHFKQIRFQKQAVACLIVPILFLGLLIVPYVSLTHQYGNGDILSFEENQDLILSGSTYSNILDYLRNNTDNGDVIFTIGTASTRLQYKLDTVKFVDLTLADNLATFRGLIESNSTQDILSTLQSLNVRYFMYSTSKSDGLALEDWLLSNSLLLDVVLDSRYFTLRMSSGSWILFELNVIDNSQTALWTENNFVEYTLFSNSTAATVLLDDGQDNFWSAQKWGSGNISTPLIKNCSHEQQSGAESRQILVNDGNGSRWRIYHTYEQEQNWAEFNTLSFYWFGANTGALFSIYIDAPDSTNRWYIRIAENWSGWKRLILPIDNFVSVGSPSECSVKEISMGFYSEDNVSGTWLLDNLTLANFYSEGNWIYTPSSQSDGLNYSFIDNNGILNFTVWGTPKNHVALKTQNIPSLRTEFCSYMLCLVKGTENARWVFTFTFANGTSYYFPYWKTPTSGWYLYVIDMSTIPQLQNQTFSNIAFLNLMTDDGKPASIYVDFYQIR